MRVYSLNLQSHTDIPDFEDECEAYSKRDAAEYFMQHLEKYGWDYDTVFQCIDEGIAI